MCGSWAGWSFSQSVANGWAAEDNEECGAATCWGTMVKPQGNRCWVGGDGERPTDPLCGCGKGLTLWGESICCLMLRSMQKPGHTFEFFFVSMFKYTRYWFLMKVISLFYHIIIYYICIFKCGVFTLVVMQQNVWNKSDRWKFTLVTSGLRSCI